MIPQQFIEEVQARTDIAELISSYIPLKRAGRNFRALCPFHSEKTPSFLVSPQKQIFHCFGCGEGGGSIQFLMLYEKTSFVEAIEVLAKRAGLPVPYQQGEKGTIKTSLYDAVHQAAVFFHKSLLEDKRSRIVLEYLDKRGVNKEAVRKFRIGFAWGGSTLLDYLRQKKFTLQILEKASLVVPKSGGGFRDLFQTRIIFPVFDPRSRVIGFGARAWKEKSGVPKYINSPENPLYSKRAHLFGLNFAKDEIVKNDCAIVVEGYLDMMTPFIKGVRNIVASSGTALTQEQVILLKRYTANIILVFDADNAGQAAALRALDSLLENDLKVMIVKLPAGFDPDSLVRKKGIGAFRKLLEEKEDFFDYKLGVLRKSFDLESIEGKTKVASELLLTLDKLRSEVEKYEYIGKLSGLLKVREEILIAEFKKLVSRKKILPKERFFSASGLSAREILPVTEKVVLKFMLTNPKAFSVIRRNLNEEDFSFSLARKTVAYLFKSYREKDSFSSSEIIGSVKDKEISGFIAKILIDEHPPLDKEIFKESLLKLRRKRVKSVKNKLKEEIRRAESLGDRGKLKALIDKYGKISSEAGNG